MIEILPGAAIFAADQIIKDKVACKSHHNYGFAANMVSDRPRVVRAVSVLFTIWMTAIFIISLTFAGSKLLRYGLSLLLGGAFSNTYDRVKRGYVVDYLQIPVGPRFIRRLIWNIGDYSIIVGAFLAVLGS